MKKLLSIVLSFVMTLTAVSGPVATASAATGKNSLTATRGVYWFDPHLAGIDLTDTYIYDDALLKGDSLKMNWPLATMTYELAVASISSEREPRTPAGYKNKSRNLKAYLEDNGFIDFDTNEDYKKVMTTRTTGVACAHKKIKDGGKEYTVIAIAPRSAGYEAEWGGNFMLGESGEHEGFKIGKDKVLSFARSYIEKYGIKGNIKVWTAGYSRGAAITNLVGAELIRDPKGALGSNVTLKPGDLYCYTFGTPNSTSTDIEDYNDSKFDYIHNLWQAYDITTAVPFEDLGFTRYGMNYTYADKGDKERMLKLCKELNKLVYDAYTTEGDPEVFFKPKKLDVEALTTEHKLKFVDDDDSYLPSTQADFAKLLSSTAYEAFRTRKVYKNEYQNAIEELGGYYYSHLEKGEALMNGIMGSKYAIPTVISMYLAYMSERYANNTISPEDREELKEWFDEFDYYITRAIEEGEEIPEDIKAKMRELQDQINTASRLELLIDVTREISAWLYTKTLAAGLTSAGLPEEDESLYNSLTSMEAGRAMTRVAAYFLLYDKLQTEEISFDYLNEQFKHLATLVGNAGSYQRPHNNEIILSWLRTIDPGYDDFKKENAAQISGYRRLYIDQPSGVTVKGTVKDASGKTVATFKNGKITSRKDKWIGITTSDKGNWLRVPADKTYKVFLSTSKDTKLNLKASEYDVYSGKVVRTVKKDSNYKWTGLKVKKTDKVTWVISKVAASKYKMPSKAKYYIKIAHKKKNILVAKGISKGSSKIQISWNKISGAEKYVVYFSKCNHDGVETTPKKVKTVPAKMLKWTKTGLNKNVVYKYYVAAQKKVDGKYKTIAKSMQGHTITGDVKGNFANPKSLSVKPGRMTLKVGKTKTIGASVKTVKAGKKVVEHTPLYRYRSDCPDVATVTAKGKVKAKAIGTAKIYVQAENGIWKTVKVTVK